MAVGGLLQSAHIDVCEEIGRIKFGHQRQRAAQRHSPARNANSGAAAVAQLLSRGEPFTALVASNDDMAIGAMKQLHDSGIATPGAVSVIGFDDVAIAPYIVPSLSSVRIPVTEMIKETISRLIFMLDGGEFKYQQTFSGELILRDSVIDGPHR